MADDRFENLIKGLCMLAAHRGDLNDRVDAAIFEITDYLAHSDDERDQERVRVVLLAGAEMAEEQHPNDVTFWTTVQEFLEPTVH
jgi:hypothetical protein